MPKARLPYLLSGGLPDADKVGIPAGYFLGDDPADLPIVGLLGVELVEHDPHGRQGDRARLKMTAIVAVDEDRREQIATMVRELLDAASGQLPFPDDDADGGAPARRQALEQAVLDWAARAGKDPRQAWVDYFGEGERFGGLLGEHVDVPAGPRGAELVFLTEFALEHSIEIPARVVDVSLPEEDDARHQAAAMPARETPDPEWSDT